MVKYLFLTCLGVLLASSLTLYLTLPEQITDRPVLYWVTHNDPIRKETVQLFYDWREKQGLPPAQIFIDVATSGTNKKLVQGVSGMSADLLDLFGHEIQTMYKSGMLLDITEEARAGGFGPEQTYPGMSAYILNEGRQYGYPRNVGSHLLWYNKDTFDRHDLPYPPQTWTWEEFEEHGIRFVEATNPPGTRERNFFIHRMNPNVMRRSLGIAIFNETLTRSTLDDPRNVQVYEKLDYWINDLRIMPSRIEAESFSAEDAGKGATFYLFHVGRYGIIDAGRWGLMRFRPNGTDNLGVSENPYAEFPNEVLGGGSVAIYKNTSHPQVALEFLQFLASEEYNRQIVEYSDSLPPVPEFAETENFLRPPDHPNEWNVHEPFAKVARETSIAFDISPYVVHSQVTRIDRDAQDAVILGRKSAQDAAENAARRINLAIENRLDQDVALREQWEKNFQLQQKIDKRRAAGEPIPASWIKNPFHQKYYREKGLLINDASS